MLMFGGSGVFAPALKKKGAALDLVLAIDDGTKADLNAGNITSNGAPVPSIGFVVGMAAAL
jgi:hypothetical protein